VTASLLTYLSGPSWLALVVRLTWVPLLLHHGLLIEQAGLHIFLEERGLSRPYGNSIFVSLHPMTSGATSPEYHISYLIILELLTRLRYRAGSAR